MCHGSVGLVAKALEAAGIPTVSVFIRAFRHTAVKLNVPRVLVTPHLMGRTIGPVGDRARQRHVVEAALQLLQQADAPGTIEDFEPGGLRLEADRREHRTGDS
ncbi:MAG: hypothetical protein H0V19_07225 [Euzebyales bacterium]|nr:hypothetical protein [Euzebyales bacterium]